MIVSLTRGVLVAFVTSAGITSAQPPSPQVLPELPKDTPRKPDVPYVFQEKKPDVSVTPEQFVGEFRKNAGGKKLVELTGEVMLAYRTINGDGVLTVHGGDRSGPRVTCLTKDAEPWRKALPGQEVTLRGFFSDKAGGMSIAECEIVKVTGEKPKLFTAAQYQRGHDAEELRGRHQRLTGEVENVAADRPGFAELTFATEQKEPKVYARFSTLEVGAVKKLKPGQKVTVLGKNLGGGAGLESCLILETGSDD